MTSYGYRVGLFHVTETRRNEPLDMSFLVGGRPIGELIAEELKAIVGLGERDEKRSTYFSLDSLRQTGWLFRMYGSSGIFGSAARVVDTTTHQQVDGKDIGEDEAVLRAARILAVVPPSEKVFLAAFEVQGNGSLMSHFYNALDKGLRKHMLTLRGDHDIADGVGWENYLSRDDVGIQGVDLIQHGDAVDGALVDPAGVRGLRLYLNIDPGGSKAVQILRELKTLLTGHPSIDLAPVLGVHANGFDEQKIVTVKDGKQRTINVTSGWPRFVYPIDDQTRPSDQDFESACQDVLEEVLEVKGVVRDPGWWAVGPWS